MDVTGLPLAACVVPASTTENAATERLVDELIATGQARRLEVVLVGRGTSLKAAGSISGKHHQGQRSREAGASRKGHTQLGWGNAVHRLG